MDSGPEKKPTHSQKAMIPLGYKPNHLSYKSAWFVPQYHPHLCIFQSFRAAQFVKTSYRHAQDNHGEQIIKLETCFCGTTACLIHTFKMCVFPDAYFNCFFFVSLSHPRGLCAVTDDAVVVSWRILWEAISAVCFTQSSAGLLDPYFLTVGSYWQGTYLWTGKLAALHGFNTNDRTCFAFPFNFLKVCN